MTPPQLHNEMTTTAVPTTNQSIDDNSEDDNNSFVEWVEWKGSDSALDDDASNRNSSIHNSSSMDVCPLEIPSEVHQQDSYSGGVGIGMNHSNNGGVEEVPMPLHLKVENNSITSQDYEERKQMHRMIHERAESFWHHYDECVILCLGAQLGILLRRLSNFVTSNLNLVFNDQSALASDLPVNCLALFILGVICSGNDALDIVSYDVINRGDRHEIALQTFERRIRASLSLVLFPAKREEADALVQYTHDHENHDYDNEDENVNSDDFDSSVNVSEGIHQCRRRRKGDTKHEAPHVGQTEPVHYDRPYEQNMTQLQQFQWETEQIALTIADGWDVGTTPESMKVDLMLGLRVGFCGALSTFSSWNEDMVSLSS